MPTLSPSLKPWLVVLVGFLTLALAYSIRATVGIMMPVWEEEPGWSRSFVSACVSAALIAMAFLAPIAGRLVDTHGPRGILAVGMLAVGLGCGIIALAEQPWQFVFGFSVVAAIGFGLTATHVVPTAIEQCFTRNKGFAAGLAIAGSSGGQLLVMPLMALLLSSLDWRLCFAALGVVCILIAFWVLQCLPASKPDRNSGNRIGQPGTLTSDIRLICSRPAFQILFWSYTLCGFTTTGVIETHFIPFAELCGFSTLTSASAYGLLSALNLAGMILAGWLSDRMSPRLLLMMIYMIRALTFLLLVDLGADIEILFAFAAIFGLVDYSTVPPTARLISMHLGIRVMGLAFGIISAGHQLGAALGAYLGGYLFDLYARYAEIWWASVVLTLLAGLMVLLLPRRTNLRPAASTV